MSLIQLARPPRRVTQFVAVAATGLVGLAGLAVLAQPASAAPGAIITDSGCTTSSLAANDDDSSASVALPFAINFFGVSRSSAYVNNNGNVTFGEAQSGYTPFEVTADTPPILAAFFADVDTRGAGSGLTSWGTTTYDGRPAFCANWRDVGYFSSHTDKTDDFQLLLVDRSDIGDPGDFDLIYNYGRITWETGDASNGSGGLGGTSAGVGFAAGDGDAGHFYDKAGSRQPGSFLDSNPTTSLANTSTDSSVVGRHVYEFRDGRAVGITPPDTTIASGPTGRTNNTTPTFTYTAAPAAPTTTFDCGLAPGAQAPTSLSACDASGFPVTSALAEGQYTFAVQATDADDLTDPTPATRTFTVDTTAPDSPTVSGPAGLIARNDPTFTYTDTATDVAGYQCELDSVTPGGASTFTTCPTSGMSYTGLPDGDYTLRVRAVDAAGNTGPATSRTFTVDTTAPAAVTVAGPSGPTQNTSPTYTWDTAPDVDHYQCTFTTAADASTATPTTCTSPAEFTGLTDGDYVFTVRGIDAAGNIGATTTRSITVDTTPPDSTITGGTSGAVSGSSASFTYATDDTAPGTTFECQLVGPGTQVTGFAPCPAGGTSYTGLADGTYTFRVRTVDAAGNVGAVQNRSFQVNVGRPTITISLTSATPVSASGWYRSPVTITYACDGAGSALAVPCPTTHVTKRRGLNRDVIGTVRTVDGDIAKTSVHLKIDRFAPRVYPTHFKHLRTYHQRPKIGCDGVDDRSGIASCRVHSKISRNGRWLVVHLKAVDKAGNVTKRTLRARYVAAQVG